MFTKNRKELKKIVRICLSCTLLLLQSEAMEDQEQARDQQKARTLALQAERDRQATLDRLNGFGRDEDIVNDRRSALTGTIFEKEIGSQLDYFG